MKAMKYILMVMMLVPVVFTACKKSGPAEAIITVIDSTGKRVAGAVIVLRQDSVTNPTNNVQASINQQQVSDAVGQAFFTFKLEAVLNVEVSKGNLTARDYIRLEQSKQVTKTVIVR